MKGKEVHVRVICGSCAILSLRTWGGMEGTDGLHCLVLVHRGRNWLGAGGLVQFMPRRHLEAFVCSMRGGGCCFLGVLKAFEFQMGDVLVFGLGGMSRLDDRLGMGWFLAQA